MEKEFPRELAQKGGDGEIVIHCQFIGGAVNIGSVVKKYQKN